MLNSPEYQKVTAKLRDFFQKELVTYTELKSQTGVEVPAWVYGYCCIGYDEYFIGEDSDYERYRTYTDRQLTEFRTVLMAKYNRLVISTDEMKLLKTRHDVLLMRWMVHERRIDNDMHDFSDNYKPWCPIGKDEPMLELFQDMESETPVPKINQMIELQLSGESDSFELPPIQEPISATPIQFNAAPMAFDDVMIEKMATAFADAFNRTVPLSTVPPRPKDFYVPEIDKMYIKWGIYADIKMIIDRNMFYPTFITGLSGNGKTLSVEQAHAVAGKELIITNITEETDEDDLLGGYRLISGNTVWQDGPVVIAMRRGCSLLLDEVDYGTSKLSCLQSVLAGRPVLIKKTGEVVKPALGFTVFATANTKGQGDTVGKFAGTKILNEAFLDRFPIMLHNPYPKPEIEVKIFSTALAHFRFVYSGGAELSEADNEFCLRLSKWCDIVRTSHSSGACSDVISTRRGVDILKAYVIYDSRDRAIKVGVERFNEETRNSFAKLYSAVDEQIEAERKRGELAIDSKTARSMVNQAMQATEKK